ncbi:xanthine dehydrogenase accessory protein XdhC [Roseobacter sp. EG26]|uniref:xanthine dehydrogenase accessory protein XdhC n=1 Tax=Roseobacter sp. EG26 TaxID=3412477 RepID=UPI003CE4CF2C
MSLEAFFDRHGKVIHVRQTDVRGSAPREAGAEMFVALTATYGTIGGGQLEYMAIDQARAMLRQGRASTQMNVPLGPEIGQCCGGRVVLHLTQLSAAETVAACARETADHCAYRQVYILGAGHVGRALAQLFQHLPVRCCLVDTRAEELALSDAAVDKRCTALPEAEIRQAPAGSAFIVLTHDHALDFLLTSEALARPDAAYVGLIGSATKRAKFETYCRTSTPEVSTNALICPIGAGHSTDKRPHVIASFVVAEVMARLTEPQLNTKITA